MKIAQVVCVFPPYGGGIGRVAYHFSRLLRQKGHQTVVFTPAYRRLTERAGSANIIYLKPRGQYGNGAFLPQLLFRLRFFDVVLLHYPFFGGTEAVWLAKILFKKTFKLIIHYHMDASGFSWPAKILSQPSRLATNSLFKRAEAITCASLDYIKHSSLGRRYKRYSYKFYEIPFGVDSLKFKPRTESRNGRVRQILFVGGLDKPHYFKGVDVLLAALAGLTGINYELKIVGEGDLRDKYAKLAEKLGIAPRVKFLGRLPDKKLPEIYRQADLFVLPSINRGEAFGLVLLEAMASGVPVVASNLPGVRRVFEDGVQGLSAKPGDVDNLRQKVEFILADEKCRQKMGQAGRKLVEQKYDWQRVGERLCRVFEPKSNRSQETKPPTAQSRPPHDSVIKN